MLNIIPSGTINAVVNLFSYGLYALLLDTNDFLPNRSITVVGQKGCTTITASAKQQHQEKEQQCHQLNEPDRNRNRKQNNSDYAFCKTNHA